MLMLHALLHLGDLSNMLKPKDLAFSWGARVLEEFWQQGDRERSVNLPVSPMCDRATTSVGLAQINFIEFIVEPLLEQVVRIFPELIFMYHHLRANYEAYQAEALADVASGAVTTVTAEALVDRLRQFSSKCQSKMMRITTRQGGSRASIDSRSFYAAKTGTGQPGSMITVSPGAGGLHKSNHQLSRPSSIIGAGVSSGAGAGQSQQQAPGSNPQQNARRLYRSFRRSIELLRHPGGGFKEIIPRGLSQMASATARGTTGSSMNPEHPGKLEAPLAVRTMDGVPALSSMVAPDLPPALKTVDLHHPTRFSSGVADEIALKLAGSERTRSGTAGSPSVSSITGPPPIVAPPIPSSGQPSRLGRTRFAPEPLYASEMVGQAAPPALEQRAGTLPPLPQSIPSGHFDSHDLGLVEETTD